MSAPRRLIWIASYPKSGNTWTRIMLACLKMNGKRPDLSSRTALSPNSASLALVEATLDIPTADLTAAEQAVLRAEAFRLLCHDGADPLWLKVHDRYDAALFPPETTRGVIALFRDPRDVAVSWADHLGRGIDATIDRMARSDFTVSPTDRDLRPQAQQRLGSWSGNAASWLDAAPGPKLLLRYEDMLADPARTASRLAAFAGLSPSAATIAATVAATSFPALRAAEETAGFGERVETQSRFFREGRAGGWRDVLSPAQAARLWRDHAPMMTRLGYAEDGSAGPSPASAG